MDTDGSKSWKSGNWDILSPIRNTGLKKCGRIGILPLLTYASMHEHTHARKCARTHVCMHASCMHHACIHTYIVLHCFVFHCTACVRALRALHCVRACVHACVHACVYTPTSVTGNERH